ncbi:glutathione S-transferase family protein [Parasphingopyxis sp. CP4]|uniref:glutathione S-transferase family protein n=1 Tax=Parasphingopyxis sp. CP4 TaxID=2724527 RepID=UPI0015A2B7F8|nr:glutathione S-transferase family protein [Parasphingopyxis sp. CP4]QLC21082.1 glutathione S-transferase family protein [Parasphingopyxis sp. CP4]
MEPLILHEDPRSGNCYKIRLTAGHLDIPIKRKRYDVMRGETRTPEFLETINANGKIPVLQLGDRYMPESNAACYLLATGSDLIPDDRFDHADMLRWMFWEQHKHEPTIAEMRFFYLYVGKDNLSDKQRDAIPDKLAGGEAALTLMDGHLGSRDFMLGDQFTLADIALYAYTHVAEEGEFDLSRWPAVKRWLDRVASLPGHVEMEV